MSLNSDQFPPEQPKQDTYHPRNVQVVPHPTQSGAWTVLDHDGSPLFPGYTTDRSVAEQVAKRRKATIKGALTRRRNKAEQ